MQTNRANLTTTPDCVGCGSEIRIGTAVLSSVASRLSLGEPVNQDWVPYNARHRYEVRDQGDGDRGQEIAHHVCKISDRLAD